MELATVTPDGLIRFSPHPGQWRAWNSERRFIAVIAGTQSGKTAFGPHWLYREIQRRGPGDYMVVTPTFQLLEKKALPELRKLFERWLAAGKYIGSPVRRFEFSADGARRTFGHYSPDNPTIVHFGYADDPESLESATARGAWLDEAGQRRFKLGSWEAILRRLSLAQGRALITTTPYDLGWLKQRIYDRWRAGEPDYDVIRFDSTENPAFPQDEFERARRDLPKWKFDLFYRGVFTRPAGQIYDSFVDDLVPRGHKCQPFPIPDSWDRFFGLDFGGINTACVKFAQAEAPARVETCGLVVVPPRLVYLYGTYKAGQCTAAEHVRAILRGEPLASVLTCVGGSHSEGQWRSEFRAGGLEVRPPPIKDVEVGINRVHGCHSRGEIIVFDTLTDYLEQKVTYSREVNEAGDPTERIEDKSAYHYLDAERYIVAHMRRTETYYEVEVD
jgi:hypothetical protein